MIHCALFFSSFSSFHILKLFIKAPMNDFEMSMNSFNCIELIFFGKFALKM